MKILLVDDHLLFLDGLVLLFQQEFPAATVWQAGSLQSANVLLDTHPDIDWVFLDLGLPDSQGITALQSLRERYPSPTYVVMSSDERLTTILSAIDLGAAGFIPKTSRHGELVAALRKMMSGGVYLPVSVTAMAPSAAPMNSASDNPIDLGLSPRQVEVLRLLIEGKSNKLICRELGLSESTVKTHLAAIFRKLDANTRTQAVVAAARLGLRIAPSHIAN